MCWNAPVSLAIGAAGIATAGVAHARGESKMITAPLVFFSLMELLQYASYWYIGACTLQANTLLTQISYVHIAFQPIFMNMVMMYSAPPISIRIRTIVFALCGVSTIAMLIKIVPTGAQHLCAAGETLCGPMWCSVQGNWHLAWSVPQYSFPLPGDTFAFYYFPAVFLLPFLYRAGWTSIAVFMSGPPLAYVLTSGNALEWPAVWCLYSIPIIIYTFVVTVYKRRTGVAWYQALRNRMRI